MSESLKCGRGMLLAYKDSKYSGSRLVVNLNTSIYDNLHKLYIELNLFTGIVWRADRRLLEL